MIPLPAGLIFQIATDAGIAMRGTGAKRAIRCLFHDDKHASAFLSDRNCFYCSRCTPDGGWSARTFCTALGLDWTRYGGRAGTNDSPIRLRIDAEPQVRSLAFAAEDAVEVWSASLARARDDDAAELDAPVYRYLEARRLMEAWELGAFGVLPTCVPLHASVARWRNSGHRIIAPLFALDGSIANVQSRTFVSATPRTLMPDGSRASGTMFADRRGRELLRGQGAHTVVVFGEGLTDALALSIASPVAVLAAPGTSMAVAAVGAWARDLCVLIALDNDDAGRQAVKPVARAIYDQGAKRVRRVVWPGGAKDACDVVAQRGVLALEAFLSAQVAAVRA